LSAPVRRATNAALAVALGALVAVAVARRTNVAAAELTLPEWRTESGEAGGTVARLDDEALCAAFERAGLPAPPSYDGVDSVPVRVALDAAADWMKRRDGDALGRLGMVHLAFEHRAHAAECFAAAEALGSQRERWAYLLGAACHSLQWNEAASAAFERARALDPRQALTHARLGDLHLSAGRARDAFARFDAALRLEPHLSVAGVGRARAQLELGDLDAALKSALGAVQSQPGDFAARRALADVLTKLGRHEEAARAARAADALPKYQGWSTVDPRLREAQAFARVTSYVRAEASEALRRQDWAAAVRHGETLLRRRPRDHEVQAMLASTYAALPDHPRAKAAIEAALHERPESIEYRVSLAEIELANGDSAAAELAARRALERAPDSARVHEVLGRAQFVAGRVSEGLESMERAVKLAPDSVEARGVLLEALLGAGQRERAEALVQESLRRAATADWARAQRQPKTPQGTQR
jgi:tetratricopeptide (TPR) repeat protein